VTPSDPAGNRPLGFSSQDAFSRAVFLLIAALLFGAVLLPLLFPVLMGAIFAIVLYPLQAGLVKRRIPRGIAAFFVAGGVSLLCFVPAVILAIETAKIVRIQAAKVGKSTELPDVGELLARVEERLNRIYPMDWSQMIASARDALETLGKHAAELLGSLVAQLPSMLMALIVTALSLYFFLVDGPRVVEKIRAHSFFSPKKTERILSAIHQLSRGVIVAQLACGAAQALTFVVFLLFAGMKQVGVLGVLAFFMSFIPLIGAAPLTFGVALVQLLSGATGAGITLLIGAVLAGTLDNFIRPWILRGAGEMHPLLAFVAALGGLEMLGPVGIFLGPIIVGLFTVTLRLTVFEK
jgi:predicted PurR-regulated permease PerM